MIAIEAIEPGNSPVTIVVMGVAGYGKASVASAIANSLSDVLIKSG